MRELVESKKNNFMEAVMGLEWISLSDRNEESFFDLFELGQWKIKKAIIISAYTDVEALTVLVDGIIDQKNQQEGAVIQIFLDKTASRFMSNKEIENDLRELSSIIKNNFSEDSGLFLVSGKNLFHSKCYLFEGRDYGKFFIGSLNLTESGIKKNEEILCRGNYVVGSKEVNSNFSKDIVKYCNSILKNIILNCEKINSLSELSYEYHSFKDVILDGHMYLSYKEFSPFSIPLGLPDDFKILETDIEFYDAERKDSISIEKIIQNMYDLTVNESNNNSNWKKYCIETCYGYWAPSKYEMEISGELSKKNDKVFYYESIREKLQKNYVDINKIFNDIVNKIRDKVKEEGCIWEFDENKKWDKWYERIMKKIDNEDFIKKLCSSVNPSPCIDVWEDKIVKERFEESFEDSIMYLSEKGITHNKIISTLKKESKIIFKNDNVLENIKSLIKDNRKNIFIPSE